MTHQFRITPGHPASQVIIHVPHASRFIPADVRASISLDDAALERELDAMTDGFTDVIAKRAAATASVRPWLFVNQLSRLVVDPERFPDDREEMNAVGMGAVYTRTSDGFVLRDPSADEISGLVGRHFEPYAEAFTGLVGERLAACDNVTIIDLHSYPLEALPYELHGNGPRPQLCLGTDEFHTPDELIQAARDAFKDFEVGQDSPFSGCYVPLAHYGRTGSITALMIELRRDLYMDESFDVVPPAVAPIVDALAALADALDPYELVTCRGTGDLGDYQIYEEKA